MLLEEDEKGVHTVNTLGGSQDAAVVYESGLYALIFKSRKPEAKAFRKWVTSEVLPTLRRHGCYPAPAMSAQAPAFGPNEIRQLITPIVVEVVKAIAPAIAPVRDFVTVEQRCEQRWPTARLKERRRVRDVTVGLLWQRRQKTPLKMGTARNSPYVFEREDLDVIDEAIDRVIEEVTGHQIAPLFVRNGNDD